MNIETETKCCVSCGKEFLMPKGFRGTILCEDCDPFMNGVVDKPTTPVDSKQTAKEHDDKIREEAVERVFNWLSEANYDCTVQELYEKYLKGLSGDKR